MPELRVLDAGEVGAVRSQSFWHGIAAAMGPDGAPTLSFCSSAEPYVSIGHHRSLDEIDLAACGELGLPVIRRQLGGGPVYIDSDQLFFQITVPAAAAPARIDRLYRRFLGPAVTAFRRLGLDAGLEGLNDIAVGDRKISGTGAGRIGEGVIVVGNVLFRFPRRRMAEVLTLPAAVRPAFAGLMERYVASIADLGLAGLRFEEARQALIAAYAEALGLRPAADEPTRREREAMVDWDARLTDGRRLAGGGGAARHGGGNLRRIKVNARVALLVATDDGIEVQATIVDDIFRRVVVDSSELDGDAAAMGLALAGTAAEPGALGCSLEAFGDTGRRLAALLRPALALP